ncbi:MAG: tetratricopeptide repeat protein [Planctomycetes bacterium]|nr:tetratricopeptide repeat protein [Planctomycetota bacterium]MBI3847786.1 tetratricopeptide repeat protein [Planctomycetota bacterium]
MIFDVSVTVLTVLSFVVPRGSLDDGRALLAAQKFDDAKRTFESVLVDHPDDLDAGAGLGRALYGLGDLDDAQTAVEAVLAKSPRHAEARFVLGLTTMARADAFRESASETTPGSLIRARYEDACRCFEAVVEADPTMIDAWMKLGEARILLEDFAGAASAYASVLATMPGDVEAHTRLGEVYCRYLHDGSRAVPHLEAALVAAPTRLDARRLLAEARLAEGHEAEAVAEYRRILDGQPDDEETWNALWALYGAKRQYDEARTTCNEIVAKNPTSAWAHYQLGYVEFSEKKLPRAIDEFQKAVELNPQFDALHRLLGDCFLAQNDSTNATSHYLAAVRINPRNDEAFIGLVTVARQHASDKRYDSAVDAFQHAIKVRPTDAVTHANLALTYKDMGRTDDAVRSYQKAVELAPMDSQTMNDLGLAYEAKRDDETAMECYRKARAIDGNLDAMENMGALFMRRGDWASAMAELKAVLMQDPKRDRSTHLYSESRRAAGEKSPQ